MKPARDPHIVRNTSLLMVGAFGVWGLADPEGLSSVAAATVAFVFESVGWLYLVLCTGFLVLSIYLALGPYGRIRLGPDDSRPEFSTLSWLAMLFAGGMGAGLVFWGVAEPVTHFAQPPGDTPPGTAASARLAMVLTNLHWGLHAWATYAVCALVIGYFTFRRGMPGLISTPIRAALPLGRVSRSIGVVSDVIGVFAVVFGLAGSLVLGILQVRAGLQEVYQLEPTTTVSIVILGVITVAFMTSASTGLAKGIQILSNVNVTLAILLLLFVLLVGPTSYALESFLNAFGDYFAALPSFAFRLFSYERDMEWSSDWTLTYLIWWVAWSPFVGLFIARISRGRTIREFCIGVILVPTLFSMFWFAVFGGTGIWVELEAGGGLADLVSEDASEALFDFLSFLPGSTILSGLSVLLIFIFLVTSADSGTFVVSMMTSEGSLEPALRLKLLWGAAIAALTTGVLLVGTVEVAKGMAIFGAIPFTLILMVQLVAFLRAIRHERRRR